MVQQIPRLDTVFLALVFQSALISSEEGFLMLSGSTFGFQRKEKGICRASANIEPAMKKQHMYCPKIHIYLSNTKSASSKTFGIFNILSGSHHEHW